MRNVLILLKVQILSALGGNPNGKKGKSKQTKLGGMALVLLLIGVVIIGVGYLYSKIFLPILSDTGSEKEIFTYMISISVLLAFFFSFYSVASVLYGTKDYDMLSALPLSKWQIVLAKFIYISLTDVLLSLLLVVPAFIVYAQSFALEVGLVVNVLLITILVSGVPISLAIIVGTLFSFLSTRFKHKNLIQTVLMFVFLIGIMVLSFMSGEGSIDTVIKLCFFAPLISLGVNNILYALLMCAVSIASVTIVCVLVTVFYQKINSLLLTKRTNRKFMLKSYKGRSEFYSLFRKEMRKLFSSPVYALNTLMGCVMAVLLGVVLGVLSGALGGAQSGLEYVILPYLPTVLAFSLMLSPTTCVSISLEGSAFWIIKSSPISMKKLLSAKLALNMLFGGIASLISSITFGIIAGLPVGIIFLILFISLLISSLGGVVGLVINCRFYRLDYKNDTEAVKRGLSTFLMMVSAMLYAGLLGLGAYLLTTYVFTGMGYLDSLYLILIFTGLTLALNIVFYILLYTKGEKLLKKGE